MNNEDKILNIATRRLEQNRDLQDKFAAMDAMNHSEWQAPWTSENPRPAWWRDFPTSQPSAAIKAYTRMFSKVAPIPTLTPLQKTQKHKDRCNDIEGILMWQYELMQSRGEDITYTIVEHAGLYAKVCMQVVYLPWQRKIAEQLETKRMDVQGDFAYLVEHPSNVHENKSKLYGLQDVLLVKDVPAEEIIAAWGNSEGAKKVQKVLEESEGDSPVFRLYDWTDDKHRVVLAYEVDKGSRKPRMVVSSAESVSQSKPITLCNEEHKLPFLSWVVERRGSLTETDPAKQVSPLLNSLYEGGKWDSINFWRSLMRSDTIATALRPKGTVFTADAEEPEESFDTPGGTRVMRTGDNYQPEPPAQNDPRMREFQEQDASEIGESTIPRIIADPGVESGVSFASTNQMYNAAESTLDPFSGLAARVCNMGYKLMLMWKIHDKAPLMGMKVKRMGMKSGRETGPIYSNDMLSISSDEIPRDMPAETALDGIVSASQIYCTTRLTASNPLDQVSEMQALNMMRQAGFPDEMAYEMAGYHNPQDILKGRYQQQLVEAVVGQTLATLQAMGQSKAQAIMMKAQMEMQQQAQQAQQPPTAPPPDVELPPNSTAAGMIPPNVAGEMGMATNPGQLTPEQQTQQTIAKALGDETNPGGSVEDLLALLKGNGALPGQGGASPLQAAPGALTYEAVSGKSRPTKGKKK